MTSVGGDQNIVARVEPHADVKPGDEVELLADLDYLHAFDLENEDNLRFK
jgi:multiple sugar transport system ATP-binding protein